MRPEILGTHGMVAGGRHYWVSAGVRILQQGGNAVDAGVASVLAASVCEISHFGFGGEAPTMIYDAKTKEIIVINGQGPAPKAATPALFAERGLVPATGRSARRYRRCPTRWRWRWRRRGPCTSIRVNPACWK
jgi:gamma-glutamyltranspeptidase / glutathione hydrolase